MRSSIRDIAEKASVSHVTVANVLRGTGRVSEATRRRVLEVAEAVDYIPVARPASQRRRVATHVVGLIFHEFQIEDKLGLATYQGLRQGAREHEYDLMTLLRPCRPAPGPLGREEARFLDKRCDGFVFIGPYDNREVFDSLARHDIPAVACYNSAAPEGMVCVTPDNAGAMGLAVEHLASLGHRRIAHLAGPLDHSDARARRAGFRAAADRLGLGKIFVQEGTGSLAWAGIEDMKRLLASGATAAVCINDGQALQLWRVAEECGYRVPEDFSIVGMDDIPEAAERGLTTLAYSPIEIGRLAIDALVGRLRRESPLGIEGPRTVPVSLLERGSVAPLANLGGAKKNSPGQCPGEPSW